MTRLWTCIAAAAFVTLLSASSAFAQAATNATTTGAASSATGSSAASSAASGGGASAAAAGIAAAAAAAGGSALPSFAATPAASVVKPVLLPVTATAYTGVIVEEVIKFSDQFCTPASFTPPVSNPANYTGPGMSITFTTGTCTIPSTADTSGSGSDASGSAASTATTGSRKLFDASSSSGDSGVNATVSTPSADNSTASGNAISCTEPSLVIIKTPAIYTSAYTSAAEFTGKECKVAKMVEKPTAEVLYTFDDANPIDPLSLASLIQSKLATILTDGYQDLVKQIASSVTIAGAAPATITSLVGSAVPVAPATGAAAAAAAAGPSAATSAAAGRR